MSTPNMDHAWKVTLERFAELAKEYRDGGGSELPPCHFCGSTDGFRDKVVEPGVQLVYCAGCGAQGLMSPEELVATKDSSNV